MLKDFILTRFFSKERVAWDKITFKCPKCGKDTKVRRTAPGEHSISKNCLLRHNNCELFYANEIPYEVFDSGIAYI